MSSKGVDKSEQSKIRELAHEYSQRGYQVITNKKEWPPFLVGLEPDLVAVSEFDKVVVEVKVRRQPRERLKLHAMAEVVNKQPGWRLELVVVDEMVAPPLLTIDRVRSRLDEAERVFEISPAGAFLLTWSAIEALLRTILVDAEVAPDRMSQVMMIKTATAEGLISQETSDLLSNAAQLRNLVAHGISEDETLLQPRAFKAFLLEARSMLSSHEQPDARAGEGATVDDMVEWFFENYEDPANGVPFETAEGGYIYHRGGPYDAEDVLLEHFEGAEEATLEAAKGRIEDEGLEWVKKGQYP